MKPLAAAPELLALFALSLHSATTVVGDTRVNSTRNVVLIGAVSELEASETAAAFLGSAEITAGRLVIYPSKAASSIRYREGQSSCRERTLSDYLSDLGLSAQPPSCPVVWESLKFEGTLILRTVGSGCRTSSKVLKGASNPLTIMALGKKHEIVELWTGIAPNSRKTWGREYPKVAVFVRTKSRLTIGLATEIGSYVRKVSGARDIVTVLRNDERFDDHCEFPSPFLFRNDAPAPSALEAGSPRVAEVVCGQFYPHPVQCWTQ